MKDKNIRTLTPKELWNAMGFPADFTIDQSVRRKEIKMSICLTKAETKRTLT